jgi:hypothetical protein
MRGDAYWCHVAVDTYRMLDAAGAYWHMTPGERSECYADDDLIRAWLDAPWVPPGDEPQTMLQAGGLDVEFEAGRLPDPASMTILVGLAQDAGVFGIPQHRVNLWRYFGDGTMPAHTFTVTVRPPDGPGWASSFVGADHLLPPTRSPIDAIAGVLQGVAGVANRLLAARDGPPDPVPHQALTQIAEADPLPPGVQGFPVGNPGRTFPPLRLVHGATSVGAADQSPQVRDSGRHR